jgi:hypothetical protein
VRFSVRFIRQRDLKHFFILLPIFGERDPSILASRVATRFEPASSGDRIHQWPGRMAVEEVSMKSVWNGACVALLLSMSALAHAQGVASAPAAANPNANPNANPVQQVASVAWQDSSAAPITRAEVHHQLVQAERDGQLQTLDKTVYAHH